MEQNSGHPLLTFYSFNGDMAPAEIERQLEGLAKQGINGFFIHARAGLEIEYLSEEWFGRCEICIQTAQRLGMSVYIYDENGWPSGFCGGLIPAMGDEYRSKSLVFVRGTPAGIDPRYILAAYRETDGGCVRIPYGDAGAQDLVMYYETDENYVDLMNPAVTEEFIRLTHEQYKSRFGHFFGNVIKGLFTDEPHILGGKIPWSSRFLEYYREHYGRDILDDLWRCRGEYATTEFSERFFWMISRLFTQNFSKRIYEWCSANRLEFTGHYAGEDGLLSQVELLGGVMPHYRYQQMPGIDHLGKRLASPVLMKQVSSAAEMMGRGRILSEVLGCAGWDISFREIAWIWSWHAVFGINVPCLHLSAYSIKGRRKRDYPAFYSHQSPWWEHFGSIAAWMDGVNRFVSAGQRRPEVLVLSAVDGSRCLGLPLHSERLEMSDVSNQYRELIQNLLDNQVDFDLGDESILRGLAEVKDGRLLAGPFAYSTVIVPEMPSVSGELYALLEQFSASGGRLLIVNRLPRMIAGVPRDGLFGFADCVLRNRRDLWTKAFKTLRLERSAELLDSVYFTYPEGVSLRCTFDGDTQNIFLFNARRGAHWRDLLFRVPYAARIVRVDPATGAERELPSSYNGSETYLTMDLGGAEALLIRAEACPRAVSKAERSSAAFQMERVTGVRAELTGPNALMIDRAAYSIDGAAFSPEKPVVHLHDEIYGHSSGNGAEMHLRLRYRFRCGDGVRDVRLAFEDEGCTAFTINGKVPAAARQGWYIDSCIGVHPIGDCLLPGENIVELQYELSGRVLDFDLSEVFETKKNIFFYDIEPESVYLLGDFDVRPGGSVVCRGEYYSLRDPQPMLVPSREKSWGDLTAQDCWFYRGDASYAFTAEKAPGGCRTWLALEEPRCTMAKLYVNGSWAGDFAAAPLRLDITDHLTEDCNRLELLICGSNRNLLGPHHHIKGNPPFVGVNTFLGTRGYEDFISPELTGDSTWTEDIAVVPFHPGEIWMIRTGS